MNKSFFDHMLEIWEELLDNKFLVIALFLAGFLIGFCETIRAEDSIVVTTNAWHASNHNRGGKDTHFNETNWGLGYEYELTDNNRLSFGFYDNSFNRHSNYIGDLYQPYHWRVFDGQLSFGAFFGNITGYPETTDFFTKDGALVQGVKNKTWNPMIIPVVSYTYHGVGINMEILPVPPLNQNMILGFQVKVPTPW